MSRPAIASRVPGARLAPHRITTAALAALAAGARANAQALTPFHATRVVITPDAEQTALYAAEQERSWRAPPGLEATLTFGGGAQTDLSSDAFTTAQSMLRAQFSPGPSMHITMGYHVTPWFSTGLSLAYTYFPVSSLPAGANVGRGDSLSFGAYGRFYLGRALHWRRIEPWVSVGFDPSAQVWTMFRGENLQFITLTNSVAVPLTIALEYNVSPGFAVGAMAQASWWFPWQRCATVANTMVQRCSGDNLTDNTSLFAGLSMRFTAPR